MQRPIDFAQVDAHEKVKNKVNTGESIYIMVASI